MPRNGSGTFTLVSGNPVVTGTTIESNWANTTLSDIATTLTDSLSRSGQGGMTAALRIADGSQGAPGVGFANETGSGFYRAGTGEVWAVVQGAQTLNLDANGVYVPADKTTTVDGAFVFNEAGADKDARFEGDTDANLLFTDASTDRVGIGTNTPSTKLDVVGDVTVSGAVNAATVNATTLDLTNIEVTNIKAKDGTASMTLADATGVATFSANPILDAGTANGVLYLDGSKVATSGSALTYNGSVLGVNNAGDSDFKLTTSNTGSGSTDGLLLRINSTGSEAYLWNWEPSSVLIFGANGSEQMRLTSTGLGIGTSSPGAKVDAAGNIRVSYAAAAANASLVVNNTSSTAASTSQIIATNDASRSLRIQYTASGGAGAAALTGGFTSEVAQIFTDNNYPISIGTNSVARLNIDTSGNLGLGVTPSAWRSGALSYDVARSSYADENGTLTIASNAYRATSNWLYKVSTFATRMDSDSGQFRWYTAPSGTAGNAISFTQAMTLTAAGDLLVGTTSFATPGFALNPSGYFFIGNNAAADGWAFETFQRSGVTIGTITQNGTTSVSYNTSSDYRLKNITGPVTNSGAYIDSLNPVEGTWKADGSTFVGLIAHEVQEASRTKVATGVKDGEEMQGMDYSSAEIIANIIAELQSLRARVAALEAQP